MGYLLSFGEDADALHRMLLGDKVTVQLVPDDLTHASSSAPSKESLRNRSTSAKGWLRPAPSNKELIMKVLASVKRICRNCKIIRRNGVVRVICTDPRHKQRQG